MTVDIATQMYITEYDLKDYKLELIEWTNLCIKYMRDYNLTLADLFK